MLVMGVMVARDQHSRLPWPPLPPLEGGTQYRVNILTLLFLLSTAHASPLCRSLMLVMGVMVSRDQRTRLPWPPLPPLKGGKH